MTFTLAVCAEMVHADLPMVERVKRLHAQGFAVEIWDWTKKDLAELAATGARFTSMTGYVEGDLIDPDGADTLVQTAEQSRSRRRESLGQPEPEPARHRPRRGGPADQAGRGRHR